MSYINLQGINLQGINLQGINPSLVRFTEWLATNATTDTKVETIYQYLNQYTQEAGPEQPGTFTSQIDEDYEAYLAATNQQEAFRRWQLEKRKKREGDREDEELTQELSCMGMEIDAMDEDSPNMKLEVIDEDPLAEFLGASPTKAATQGDIQDGTSSASAEPSSSGAVPTAYRSKCDTASRVHLHFLFTKNILGPGDELRVPIYAHDQPNGNQKLTPHTTASMVYQDRSGLLLHWLVYCPSLGVTGRSLSGKGPAQYQEQLFLMNLVGPKKVGWSNAVEVWRGQNFLGSITKVKNDNFMSGS